MLSQVINEALGEFPQQYSLAREISETVINMVKIHDRKGVFKASTNGIFKTYTITIEYSEDDERFENMLIDMRQTSGSFDGADFDAFAIKYFISRIDVLKQNYESLKKQIYNITVHELSHGYVIVAQAKYNIRLNRDLVNNLPTWYEPIIKFINNYQKEDDIIMRFAKALYACYEKEMKAIVSETTPHIEKELGCKPSSTRNDFINALKNCEPFKRYYQALYEILPEARLNKEKIKQVFNMWNIEYGDWMFDFIAHKSTIALKYIEKNAMIYFHEYVKLGKTDWFENHYVKR